MQRIDRVDAKVLEIVNIININEIDFANFITSLSIRIPNLCIWEDKIEIKLDKIHLNGFDLQEHGDTTSRMTTMAVP